MRCSPNVLEMVPQDVEGEKCDEEFHDIVPVFEHKVAAKDVSEKEEEDGDLLCDDQPHRDDIADGVGP